MKISRSDIVSLLQEALLGTITDNVRAIIVNISRQEFIIKVFYERAPNSNETDIQESIIQKIAPKFALTILGRQIILPKPEPIPLKKEDQWIFCKYEDNSSLFKVKTFFKHISKTNILMASQFAFLGNITENLRAVSLESVENDLSYFFYYNKDPNYEDRHLAEIMKNTVLWSIEGVTATLKQFVLPEPEKILLQEGHVLIYKRYEKQIH